MNRTGWAQTVGDIEAELVGVQTQIRMWEAICAKESAYYGQAFNADWEELQALSVRADELRARLEAAREGTNAKR